MSEETEWSLGQDYFKNIDSYFGSFDIDLFATSINNKCQCFISWLPDPLTQAVDAFTLDWSNFYFYAFLLFILILKVLRTIITERAKGIVVVPW